MAKGKFHEWLGSDGLLKLEAWARDGLTDEQIANNIGIVPSTLYEWKKKFPKITESLKRGKEVIDIQVENALFKRAMGYTYTEKKVEQDEKGNTKITNTVKEVAPDVTAQIFWLKNRKPIEWRDKQVLEHEGNINSEVEINIGVDDFDD